MIRQAKRMDQSEYDGYMIRDHSARPPHGKGKRSSVVIASRKRIDVENFQTKCERGSKGLHSIC